jgi:anti-sigma B factor antagonist
MIWSSSRGGKAFIGQPQGRVDEGSWEAFLAALTGAISEAAEAQLPMILDLSGIEYMSSRGLRVLTLARKEAIAKGVDLTLAKPNEMLREILSISRYDKIFTVMDTLD